ATSTWPGPSSSTTSAPSFSAFSFSPNLATFPPPDRGFMIRNARVGGETSRTGIPGSATGGASARRAAPTASARSTPAPPTPPRAPGTPATPPPTRARHQAHHARPPPSHPPGGGQNPAPARRYQAGGDHPDDHRDQGTPGMPFRKGDQDRCRGKHQNE